jgi:CRISPR-associated endonuclease Csy4
MDAYIEIHVQPDPEFPANMLMNALFAKLHRALVAHGRGDVGLSFPEGDQPGKSLGTRLRLHGSAQALETLMAQDWLRGMRDHTRVLPLAPVPAGAQYRAVRRVQADASPERERRRLMRRQNLTEAQALARIPERPTQWLKLPFVSLHSQSTGQQFRLFIEHLPLQAEPVSGNFGSYGLSNTATIPWF